MADYHPIKEEITELIIYRNILADSIIQKLVRLLNHPAGKTLICECASELIVKAETLGLNGNLFKSYLIYLIARDENMFSITAERTGGQISGSLYDAVLHDMRILKNLFNVNWTAFSPGNLLTDYTPTTENVFPELTALHSQLTDAFAYPSSTESPARVLLNYYTAYGYGDIAGYKAFRWQDGPGMTPIRHFDAISLADIVGYERQKQTLIANTEAFISGKPANNVLLIGARGTGKSSSVKALANAYFSRGLRLIEITKQQLCALPAIMEVLRSRAGKRFIIFLDDLSFEEFEVEYKFLKSVIEGGVEAKPDNVLIYATSNRRHLIKETWNDRSGESDEIHRFDSVHEKISLSDRFGITITYLAPDQNEYLQIVGELARKHGVDLSPEQLKQQAIRWEMAHSGRSGRTARQFITYLMGQ